jgi:hypothetical protein
MRWHNWTRRWIGNPHWTITTPQHDHLNADAQARGPAFFVLEEGPAQWRVRQILADPAGDHDWSIAAIVDLAACDEAGEAVVTVTKVGQAQAIGNDW